MTSKVETGQILSIKIGMALECLSHVASLIYASFHFNFFPFILDFEWHWITTHIQLVYVEITNTSATVFSDSENCWLRPRPNHAPPDRP